MTNASPRKRPEGLPPDTLSIKNGQVHAVEEFTLWNGTAWKTLSIERIGKDRFRANMSDPEHGGGGPREGTLEEATEGLHHNFVAWYKYVFSLVELHSSIISYQSLERYELKFEQRAAA